MRARHPIVASARVGALLVAGCGGSDGDAASEQEVRETVTRFAAAFADGDGKAACALVTPAGRRYHAHNSGVSSCARLIAEAGGVLPPETREALRNLAIGKVKISGDRANGPRRRHHDHRGSSSDGFVSLLPTARA